MDLSAETPKRQSSASSSPDFEFWMVNNPNSFPQSPLLTADELFVDGVLLPLHLLSLPTSSSAPGSDPIPQPQPEPEPEPERDPSALGPASISASPISNSKRWRDIFKVVGEKKGDDKEKEKRSNKDRKSGGGSGGGSAAEININIWPFARSRSAGDGAAARRPKPSSSAPPRKSCSAPCSRSNSRGGSGSGSGSGSGRRWAASPGRGGVHLGRTGPVWQLKRAAKGPPAVAEKDTGGGGGKRSLGGVRVLNSCIGYRNQVSCRGARSKGEEGSGGNVSLFNLRSFFSKKVY